VVAVHVPGALLAAVAVGVPGGVEGRLGCGELTAGDAIGDGVIEAGLVAAVHPATRRPATIVVATREIEESIRGLRTVCPQTEDGTRTDRPISGPAG